MKPMIREIFEKLKLKRKKTAKKDARNRCQKIV